MVYALSGVFSPEGVKLVDFGSFFPFYRPPKFIWLPFYHPDIAIITGRKERTEQSTFHIRSVINGESRDADTTQEEHYIKSLVERCYRWKWKVERVTEWHRKIRQWYESNEVRCQKNVSAIWWFIKCLTKTIHTHHFIPRRSTQ